MYDNIKVVFKETGYEGVIHLTWVMVQPQFWTL